MPSPTDESDLNAETFQAEQVRMHAANLPFEVAGSALTGLLLAVVQWDSVSRLTLLGWLALLGLVLGARTVTGLAQRRALTGKFDSARLLRRLHMHTVAHGLAWGLAGVALYPANDFQYQAFLALVVVGMTAGCMAVTTIDLRAGLLFNLPALLPLSARLLIDGGETHVALSAMGLLFLAVITMIGLRTWRNARDIHSMHEARARNREALDHSEARFRDMALNVPGAIYQWRFAADGTGGFTYMSPRFSDYFGFEPVQAAQAIQRIHPDDMPAFEASMQETARDRPGEWNFEGRYLHPEGRLVWWRARALLARADESEAIYNGVLVDVTAERVAALKLARSEQRFRALTELSTDWYWEQDEQYRFTKMSHQDQSLVEAAIGLTRWARPTIGVSEAQWEAHRALLQAHEPFREFEYGVRRPDGREFWLSSSGSPCFDESGRFAGYQGVGRDITARKAAEAALRLANERLDLAMRGSGLTLWDYDMEQGTVFLDETWSQMVGTSGHGVYYMPIEEVMALIHPDESGTVQEQFRETITGRVEEYSVDHRIRTDRGWKWIHSHAVVTARNIQGRATRMTGTCSDISERKLAEEKLRNLALEQDAMLSASPVAIFVTARREIVSANVMMEVMFGYNPGEMNGLPTRNIVASLEQWEDIGKRGYRAIESKGLMNAEIEYLRKDGSRFWGWLQGVRIDPTADHRRYLFTITDVTDRKRAEQALRKSEAEASKLALVAARTNNAVILTDASGRIEWVNEGFTRMTGYASDEVRGLKPGHFLAGENTDLRATELMREAEREGRAFHAEILNYAKDRRAFWVEIDAQPMRDEAGNLTGFMAIESDITERWKFEQQLREAKEAADTANRAKSTFLATMSHEIRTPMNAIIGMHELLAQSKLDEQQSKMIGVARDSADMLLQIIKDILDISRIEAGQLEIKPEPASLREVIAAAVATVSDSASRKGLSVDTAVDPKIAPLLLLDPLRMKQILFNLVSNSIKFTDRGDVEIRARVVDNNSQMQLLCIEVEDSGIGIPAEDQTKLFQPFAQADSNATRRLGGTGLGLFISRRLAQMMGGTLTMASEPGRGTTMTLNLQFPQVSGAAGESPVALAARSRPLTATAAGVAVSQSDSRVLIAEDNVVNQFVLQSQLAALGYEADMASNGRQALELWRRGRYALVICDCQMHEMDGYTFARRVRAAEAKDPLRRRTPIVACTANAMRSDADLCYAAGMDDFLPKPMDMAALARTLAVWIPAARRDALPRVGKLARKGKPSGRPSSESLDLPAIDQERLVRVIGPDPSTQKTLLTYFKESEIDGAGSLQAALKADDMETVAARAHELRGAAATVGAKPLAAICERIELAARQGESGAVRAFAKPLAQEIDRIIAYLDQTTSQRKSARRQSG